MDIFKKWLKLKYLRTLLWKDTIYRKLIFALDDVEKKREDVQDYSKDMNIDIPKKKKKKKSRVVQNAVAGKGSVVIQSAGDISFANFRVERPAREKTKDIHVIRLYRPSTTVKVSFKIFFDCVEINMQKVVSGITITRSDKVLFKDLKRYGVADCTKDLFYNPVQSFREVGRTIELTLVDTVHPTQGAMLDTEENFRVSVKGSKTLSGRYVPRNKHYQSLATVLKQVSHNKKEEICGDLIKAVDSGNYSKRNDILYARMDETVQVRIEPNSSLHPINEIGASKIIQVDMTRTTNGYYFVPTFNGWVNGIYITLLVDYIPEEIVVSAVTPTGAIIYEKYDKMKIKQRVAPGTFLTVSIINNVDYITFGKVFSPSLDGYISRSSFEVLSSIDRMLSRL